MSKNVCLKALFGQLKYQRKIIKKDVEKLDILTRQYHFSK